MTRLVSGLALAAAAVAAIIFLPPSFLVVVACVVTALAGHELIGITGPRDAVSQWLADGMIPPRALVEIVRDLDLSPEQVEANVKQWAKATKVDGYGRQARYFPRQEGMN